MLARFPAAGPPHAHHQFQRQWHPFRRDQGLPRLVPAQDADVLCIQETKAQEDQLTDPMFRPDGHHCFYRDAITKKGYSGVAIYSKREPDQVITSLGWARSTTKAATSRRATATSAWSPSISRRAARATCARASSSK
jgi:exonuclease III